METRCSLNHIAVLLLLGSVFFIFPHSVFAEETSALHAQFVTAIIDRYHTTAPEAPLGDRERAWIAWGVAHEGIPARALHHLEKDWMRDSREQSVSVYEGVYTWEQGISDYARGEKQRALETLGHLLHLIVDAHPAALSGGVTRAIRKNASVRTWRDIVEEESERDMSALTQEGADMMRRFFTEARQQEVTPPFLSRVFSVTQERLTFARTNIQRATQNVTHGIRAVLARVPPPHTGGVSVPQQQIAVQAKEAVSNEKENTRTRAIAPLPAPPAPLPLATSVHYVPPSPPFLEEPVQTDIPLTAIMPAPAPIPEIQEPASAPPPSPSRELPESPQSPPPVLPLPLPPPPLREELDEFGFFPLGTVRTHNRAPPETTLTATPMQLTNATTATFVFSSSKAGTFLCTLDGGEEQVCTSPANYGGLLEGSHTFSVRARDIFGTYDATPQTHTWTIDATPPDTTLTQFPTTLTSSRSATFAFTTPEQNATFGYALDNGSWQEAPSPLTLADLADGNHTVAIRAIDAAGNVDATPAAATWVVDATSPEAPTLTSPVAGTSYTTIASAVTLAGAREDGATIAIDGSGGGITTPTATTWEKTIALALGVTTLTITATDAAGNMSASLTLTMTRVANQPPQAISNLTIAIPITTNDRVTLIWSIPTDSDIPAQTLSYALRYAPAPIADETSWNAAADVLGLPAVGVGGAPETFTVTGLTPATTYYFALRTSDGDLLSSLSNSATGATHYGVRITDAHFQGNASAEYMTITNERSDARSLQGWKLHDVIATPSHTYTFGAFTLAAGAIVTVHTGNGVDTATDLYWNSGISIWNDSGGDTAFLKDDGGILIDSVSW